MKKIKIFLLVLAVLFGGFNSAFAQTTPLPIITSIIPGVQDSGTASQDTGLIISGVNLLGATGVNFYNANDIFQAKITNPDTNSYMGHGVVVSLDGTQAQVVYGALRAVTFAPDVTLGNLKISIVTPAGESNKLPFTFLGAPTISSITPNVTIAGSGASISIYGVNFWGDAGSVVEFYQNGQYYTSITPLRAMTRVIATSIFIDDSQDALSSKLPVGTYQVQVANTLNGVTKRSNVVDFSVIAAAAIPIPNPTASELTATIISPTTNSLWASGSTQTINWRTTGLKNSTKGQIILTKPVTSSSNQSVQIPVYYLVADNVPNTGSYTWNINTVYVLNSNLNKSSLNQISLPTGSYKINILFAASYIDLLPPVSSKYLSSWSGNIIDSSASGVLNALGETGSVILNIGTAGSVSTPSVIVAPVCDYARPPEGCNYIQGPNYNSTTSCGMTLKCSAINSEVEGCSSGNIFNTQTGESCSKNPTPPALGCSGGNIYNTQIGQICNNNTNDNIWNNNQNPSTPSSYNFGTTTLRNGSRGEAVKELQRFLNDKLNLGLVLDGKLGSKTIAVIKKWQADHGLVVDGFIGKMTKARMLAEGN